MFDGIVKSYYLPALLRRKQAGMCHSERGTTEESLKTNAPVQPDSSSQAPQNDNFDNFYDSIMFNMNNFDNKEPGGLNLLFISMDFS